MTENNTLRGVLRFGTTVYMAALSETAVTDIQWVVNYLTQSNGLERPFLDDKSREVLGRHYAAFGYTDQIKFLEDLNLRPIATLLGIGLTLNG